MCQLCHYLWVVSHFIVSLAIPVHQGVGYRSQAVYKGSRTETWCQIVLRQIPQMGDRRSPLVHHPPWYVSTCCQAGAEGGGEVVWQGCQQSLQRPNPEADIPTIKLVGYQTSHKEIRDLYHSVYLLRRSPSPLPCGPQQRKEAIWDILSSLRNWLHRWGYPTASEEDMPEAAAEPWSRPRRRETPHNEALQEAREAHQWTLEAAHALESDIKRLSQQVGDAQNPHPCSHSSSWPQKSIFG